MPAMLPEVRMSSTPDRIIALVDPEWGYSTDLFAEHAITVAKEIMPKVTGSLAMTLTPLYGIGYFGIYFPDRRVWFLEQGTRARTMHSLSGKIIPMWIDDPTGKERRENPKARTRSTLDGRTQVLIFRRVGVKGAARQARGRRVARYPGQAGRIVRREAGQPLTTPGRTGGRIAKGNVGVSWRNPGMVGRRFLNYAMTVAAEADPDVDKVYLADGVTSYALLRP